MSHVITISENSLVRSYKCTAIDTGDLASNLVNYQTSYYKVITSLKYIKLDEIENILQKTLNNCRDCWSFG